MSVAVAGARHCQSRRGAVCHSASGFGAGSFLEEGILGVGLVLFFFVFLFFWCGCGGGEEKEVREGGWMVVVEANVEFENRD
jgi:hypothetical protein